MKHSNEQEHFASGAKRDTQRGKLRYDLISPLALKRVAQVYTDGAEHYSDRNWEAGMPFSRVLASLERHLMAFKQCDASEDHLAQMVWNGLALLHFQEAIKLGLLPSDIADLPWYGQSIVVRKGPRPTEALNTCPEKVERPPIDNSDLLASIDASLQQKRDGWEVKPTVYVAGPMRGYPDFNFPAFDKARDTLKAKGFDVISPADMDREDGSGASTQQHEFAARDTDALIGLAKNNPTGKNGIVLLPYWAGSKGAQAEALLAQWLGLSFYHDDGSPWTALDSCDLRLDGGK